MTEMVAVNKPVPRQKQTLRQAARRPGKRTGIRWPEDKVNFAMKLDEKQVPGDVRADSKVVQRNTFAERHGQALLGRLT
jgi:hypothetical protein